MRMNMSDFATFFAVARNQSFRAAGDELGLSSSAISHSIKEGANKRGNSSRLTQSFHFFMFEPIFSPVNALNQPI
ncbi:hypothetical protein G998_00916 [Escherichia coli UMEA 3889-1]|nr:hypothetical protein G998_00916 [Escherichia coli UMEA 3889-1]